MWNRLAEEMQEHLEEKLVPFWKSLKDETYGGYYGYMGDDLKIEREAEKGVILNSRILWFFSNASVTLQQPELLAEARHAYLFLRDCCIDWEQGGLYWSVTYDGNVADSTKHTYNQAFAIYALSSYYKASGEKEALSIAQELFGLIESRCRDAAGYGEAYDRFFEPASNEKLSENGVIASKTMNTLLHVFEGYTELFLASPDEAVERALKEMLDLFSERVYNPVLKRQEVFFDSEWNSLLDLHSYGHDIETSWLIDRGCQVLGDKAYQRKLDPIIKSLAERIYERAYRNHSLMNECENEKDDETRVWWVQAEAVVGFLNAWQKEPEHREYLDAASDIWDYIKCRLVDKRPGSEWYWKLDADGEPVKGAPVVEPWKCPYHNGRMCMEVIGRLRS